MQGGGNGDLSLPMWSLRRTLRLGTEEQVGRGLCVAEKLHPSIHSTIYPSICLFTHSSIHLHCYSPDWGLSSSFQVYLSEPRASGQHPPLPSLTLFLLLSPTRLSTTTWM